MEGELVVRRRAAPDPDVESAARAVLAVGPRDARRGGRATGLAGGGRERRSRAPTGAPRSARGASRAPDPSSAPRRAAAPPPGVARSPGRGASGKGPSGERDLARRGRLAEREEQARRLTQPRHRGGGGEFALHPRDRAAPACRRARAPAARPAAAAPAAAIERCRRAAARRREARRALVAPGGERWIAAQPLDRPARSSSGRPSSAARSPARDRARDSRGGEERPRRGGRRQAGAEPRFAGVAREPRAARVGDEADLEHRVARRRAAELPPPLELDAEPAVVLRRRDRRRPTSPRGAARPPAGASPSIAVGPAPATREAHRRRAIHGHDDGAARRGRSGAPSTRRPRPARGQLAREVVRRQAVHAPPRFDTRARCRYVPPLSTDA